MYLNRVCITCDIRKRLCICAYIYVDNIIIAYSEIAHVCEINQKLRDIYIYRYDMTDMGALKHSLNVRVTRSSSYIQLD